MADDIKKLNIEGQTVLSACVKKIKNNPVFKDINVYKEKINQGIKYPYFMVQVADFTEEKQMEPFYLQTYVIRVLYNHDKPPETHYTKFIDIATQLSECLDVIDLNSIYKVRGYAKNYYPANEESEFYINYDVRVMKDTGIKPKMVNLVKYIEVK